MIGGRGAVQYVAQDKLINYGRPAAQFSNDTGGDFYRDFELIGLGVKPDGLTPGPVPTTEFIHDISDSSVIPRSSNVFINAPSQFSPLAFISANTNAFSTSAGNLSAVIVPTFEFEACQVVSLVNGLVFPTGNTGTPPPSAAEYNNTNEGVYYVAYYRERAYNPNNPDASKFGNRELSSYTTTGNFLIIDSNAPQSISISVFGGDTFVTRMPFKPWNHLDVNPSNPADFTGNSQGIGMVCQSYVNPLMRSVVDTDPAAMFPPRPLRNYDTWLSNFFLD